MNIKRWRMRWGMACCGAVAAVLMSVGAAMAQPAEVTADELNVRSGPGASYPIRGTFRRGDIPTIIDRSGEWAYVVAGRLEGWVYARFLSIVPGDDGGSSGGDVGTGPLQPRYEAIGSIANARYVGSGISTMGTYGDAATLVVSARGASVPSFSLTYYGVVRSRNNDQLTVSLNEFSSTYTGNARVPVSGECQVQLQGTTGIYEFTCQASGVDHGRTLFTSQ